MQDTRPYLDQTTHRGSVYQIIYINNNDERVKVVETLSLQFEHVLSWLQTGHSIFITQKHHDLKR